MAEAKSREIYLNLRQARKVRALLWVSLPVLLACLYAGWSVFESYGLRPADGGALRPFGERLAFGGGIACLGLLLAGGLLLYARSYVLRLSRTGGSLQIETLAPFGRHRHAFEIAAVTGTRHHRGRLTLRQHVHAPWLTLRISGRSLPFILDLQAERFDRAALDRLA